MTDFIIQRRKQVEERVYFRDKTISECKNTVRIYTNVMHMYVHVNICTYMHIHMCTYKLDVSIYLCKYVKNFLSISSDIKY